MPSRQATPYHDFRQQVRRFKRSDTLTAVARLSAEIEPGRIEGIAVSRSDVSLQPFALAGIARTAVTSGNELRERGPSRDELKRLCSTFINIEDPDIRKAPGMDRLSALLRKVAFEQFGEQYSPREQLARSYSLYVDHSAGVADALSASDWEEVLGVSFSDFMRIGFIMNVALINNGGMLSRQMLRADHIAPIFGEVGPDKALEVIDQHFAAPIGEHVRWSREKEIAGREKWSPNTFQNRPLVTRGDDLIAPVPHYLIDRVSPTGLYFIGLEHVGPRFPNALGSMFEAYVGSQLMQLSDATLLTEIHYAEGKDKRKSCDYVLIFPEVVVLIEVKAARPTIDFRSGGTSGLEDAEKKVGQAYKQVVEADRLITSGHEAFRAIPTDRPRLGMIITLEPFHLRQTGLDSVSWLQGHIPVGVMGAHDLEILIEHCIDEVGVGSALLNAPRTETGGVDYVAAAEALPLKPNPLLDVAFDAWCTWPQFGDVEQPQD